MVWFGLVWFAAASRSGADDMECWSVTMAFNRNKIPSANVNYIILYRWARMDVLYAIRSSVYYLSSYGYGGPCRRRCQRRLRR